MSIIVTTIIAAATATLFFEALAAQRCPAKVQVTRK